MGWNWPVGCNLPSPILNEDLLKLLSHSFPLINMLETLTDWIFKSSWGLNFKLSRKLDRFKKNTQYLISINTYLPLFCPKGNKEKSKNGSSYSYFKDGTFWVIIKFTFGPWSQKRKQCSLEMFERCQNISENAVTKVLFKMPKPCAVIAATPTKIYPYM